jgi:hypothetical protein
LIDISKSNINILENHIELDSIIIKSIDSTFMCRIGKSSLKNISWLRFVWNDYPLYGSVAEIIGIVINFPKEQYRIHSERLLVSFSDSEIVSYGLKIDPLVDDNKFFDESKFRKTRFRVDLSQFRASGFDFLGFLQSKYFRIRFIQIKDISFDILVSMYTPFNANGPRRLMPNELLSSIKEIIQIDSLSILSGNIKYGELYSANSDPAVITFDNLHLSAECISNDESHGDTMGIHANAVFMKEGVMTLIMHVPLNSPEFSLQYSGSLNKTKLVRLNSFLEIAEHARIKSGIIHSAYYDIMVKDGIASGSLSITYENFQLAFLDSHSGNEQSFMVRIKSFLANTFKLRGTNRKDEYGKLKSGKVKYFRNKYDVFTQFLWFSLRSGVADTAGL